MIIDLFDLDITYNKFIEWVANTGAEIDAIAGPGGFEYGPRTKYEFLNEEDYVAFKLAFQKRAEIIYRVAYLGKQIFDIGVFHAPYIPIQKK